jgi:hypothetical protein
MRGKIGFVLTVGCLFFALAVLVAIGAGVWAFVNRMDERIINITIGVILTLAGVLVVAAVLSGKDVLQAYLIRRAVQSDDMSDMKQMAFVLRMLGGMRNPNVNVRIPGQQPYPQMLFGGLLPPDQASTPAQFIDTTVEQPLDVE